MHKLSKLGLRSLLFASIASTTPIFADVVSAPAHPGMVSSASDTFRRPIQEVHDQAKQATTPGSSPAASEPQDDFFSSVYMTAPPPVPCSYHLTGDWCGFRNKLAKDGLTVDLSYTNNLLGNPSGGLKQGFAYDDSFGLNLMFDLQKLLSLKNLDLYISLVQRDGRNLTGKYIGNLFNVSQIWGGENFRMDNLYLRKSWVDNRVQLSAGRLNAGDYFLQSPFYYAYVSNAYDGNPVGVFFDVPFSAYPNAQWGAYLYTRWNELIASKLGVFNTNTDVSENRYHGFNFSFHGDNGTQLIGELDLLSTELWRATVGGMYFTGSDQHDFVTGESVKGNGGVYYQLERKLYQPGLDVMRGLSAFFVMELFPERYNKIPVFYDGGLVYRGIWGCRPRDFLALGFANGQFSSHLRESERLTGQPVQHYENNVELNYRYYPANWAFVQPVVQYVIRPNGLSSISNAWVFGAQMSVTF